MSATEKIRAAMRRLGITNTRLAELTGWSRQNISNKFSRDNQTEEDIAKIADAIGCKVEILITLPDGDQI
jgi:transcriptional regulator with XRE-family HTH domain